MFFNDLARVISRYVQQWDALIITLLLPRVFAISNEKHLTSGIKVTPLDARNFVLPHCRGDGKSNNPVNGDLLPIIGFETRDDEIELLLCWTTVALVPLADKAKTSESNTREIDWFDRNGHPMHGGGMREDRFDVTQIDSNGNGTGALLRALFSEFYESLAIKFAQTEMAESLVKEC